MIGFRTLIGAALAAGTLGAVVVASAPALAKDGYYGGFWTYALPAAAAGIISGATLGVITPYQAAPYSFYYTYPAPYPYVYARNGCLVRAAIYDDWGAFRGYQRLRVAC